MLFGKREPRSSDVRRRGAYRPISENLERRELLAVINLGGAPPGPGTDNIATPPARITVLPNITGDKTSATPGVFYGVDLAGTVANQSAGVSVSDIGDVNGDGYDDFIVGAPSVTQAGGTPGSATPTAYLIFGSRTTNAGAISDWLNINANFNGGETGNVGTGRVGNLAQLGNAQTGQQNPINGLGVAINGGLPYAFPFSGVKFVTGLTTRSELGESSAPAIGFNRENGFMIGAPGAHDPTGGPGTVGAGRAFLISGAVALNNLVGTTVDLDQLGASGISGLNVTTYFSSNTNLTGARIGQSVGGIGDVITDGFPDVAIGAPNASILNGADSGAVFVISGAGITSGLTQSVDLANVGTTNFPGVIFAGATSGDQAGWSLAGVGDVNGATANGSFPIADLLIGAPAAVSGANGKAYLIYGSNILAASASPVNLGLVGTNLNTTTIPPTLITNAVLGLTISGTAGGDLTGWSVSSAGSFNGGALPDIMVGSPGYLNNTGRVDIFYGANFTPAPPVSTLYPGNALVGNIVLGGTSALTNLSATLIGGFAGDLAGYSISQAGKIRSGPGNPILIGAPGYTNNNGQVYVLPPNLGTLTGTSVLTDANVDGSVLAGTRLQFTVPGGSTQPFFGASVSGRLIQSGQTFTSDGDLVGDFIIGAPGYQPTTTGTGRAGGGIVVEGATIPLRIPLAINTQIGVEKPFGPFTNINPTSPNNLLIYVFSVKGSGTTPDFRPATDINPTTVTVNGVAFPGATVAADPKDENNDGIPDAIVTVSPRSNIGLNAGTTSLTITGRTTAAALQPNTPFTGTASISVVGGGGGGGGGGAGAASAIAFTPATTFQPPFGTDRWVPQISSLSRLGSYKPIPLRVALAQFSPPAGFNTRINNFYNPPKEYHQFGHKRSPIATNFATTLGFNGTATAKYHFTTLGYGVFTRSKFHGDKTLVFTHKTPVVPANLQTERFGSTPNTTRHPKK